MSFVGNCGTFTRGYRAMVLDVEFLYHLLYLLICAMGLFVHEFFYSLLVSARCSHVSHLENCVISYHRPHLLIAASVPGPVMSSPTCMQSWEDLREKWHRKQGSSWEPDSTVPLCPVWGTSVVNTHGRGAHVIHMFSICVCFSDSGSTC